MPSAGIQFDISESKLLRPERPAIKISSTSPEGIQRLLDLMHILKPASIAEDGIHHRESADYQYYIDASGRHSLKFDIAGAKKFLQCIDFEGMYAKLAAGADPNIPLSGKKGHTYILTQAAIAGHEKLIQALINNQYETKKLLGLFSSTVSTQPITPLVTDSRGLTAPFLAQQHGHLAIAQTLLPAWVAESRDLAVQRSSSSSSRPFH